HYRTSSAAIPGKQTPSSESLGSAPSSRSRTNGSRLSSTNGCGSLWAALVCHVSDPTSRSTCSSSDSNRHQSPILTPPRFRVQNEASEPPLRALDLCQTMGLPQDPPLRLSDVLARRTRPRKFELKKRASESARKVAVPHQYY